LCERGRWSFPFRSRMVVRKNQGCKTHVRQIGVSWLILNETAPPAEKPQSQTLRSVFNVLPDLAEKFYRTGVLQSSSATEGQDHGWKDSKRSPD
jgi:hypothetical protein